MHNAKLLKSVLYITLLIFSYIASAKDKRIEKYHFSFQCDPSEQVLKGSASTGLRLSKKTKKAIFLNDQIIAYKTKETIEVVITEVFFNNIEKIQYSLSRACLKGGGISTGKIKMITSEPDFSRGATFRCKIFNRIKKDDSGKKISKYIYDKKNYYTPVILFNRWRCIIYPNM